MLGATSLSSGGRHCHKIVLKISHLGTPCIMAFIFCYIFVILYCFQNSLELRKTFDTTDRQKHPER